MMSKEAMKLALEALETGGWNKTTAAIIALQEALAKQKSGIKQVIELYDSPDQPAQQEPVAQVGMYSEINALRPLSFGTMLYTSPPAHRTWVGLTDEEIDQGLLRSDYAFKTAEAWRAGVVFAMTKLKEKSA